MNYLKLQHEIMKAAIERKTKCKDFQYKYFETDEQFFIIPSPYCWMMGIPKELFLLDTNKTFMKTDLMNGKHFIKDSENAKQAINTNTITVSNKGKMHIFTVDDETIYIDEKYLKYFDQDKSEFMGTNKSSPIYVSENKKIVGLILPIRKDR